MSSSLSNKCHSYPSSGAIVAHGKLVQTTRRRIMDQLQTPVRNGGFISQMNLWMRGFIKQGSLIFRALLNPPIATLRLVSVNLSLFFQVGILRWWGGYPHCIPSWAGSDWGFIQLHRFLKTRDVFTWLSCLIHLEWIVPLQKRTYFFFFFNFL